MPRKYHRPPTTKRRKSKKKSSPNVLEPLPESQTDHSRAQIEDAADADAEADEAGGAVETAVDEGRYVEEAPAPAARTAPQFGEKKERAVRHLVTDYTYVLSEMKLSIGLAAFLIVALVITAILR